MTRRKIRRSSPVKTNRSVWRTQYKTTVTVDNTSCLNGHDFRRLLNAVISAKHAAGTFQRVKLYPSRNWQSRGYADIDTGTVEIAVAKGWNGEPWEILEVAQLLEHEIDHFLGLDHGDMAEPLWWRLALPWFDLSTPLKHRTGARPTPIEAQIRCLYDKYQMMTDNDLSDVA